MTCRTCQAPWTAGLTITDYGTRDADSVRRYCLDCVANGRADAEEVEVRPWR